MQEQSLERELEHRLIREAAGGNRESAGELVRAHQQSLYLYLVRMTGNHSHAEDLVQEAFVRALVHLDRFDPRFRFSTWVFTIARRLYLNAAAKRRPAYGSEFIGHSADAREIHSPEDDGAGDVLQSALLELPEVQREIVILFHQQEWKVSFIAAYLGLPEGTVKSHLHRGRRKMREFMQRASGSARGGARKGVGA